MGHANIAGRTHSITIGGTTYTLKPKVLDEYAEREEYILSRTPNPLLLLSDLPELPAAPVQPVPPDTGATDVEVAEFSQKLAAYQRQKRTFEQQVAQRVRLEQQAWQEAKRPRFVSFEDEQLFDRSLHGIAWRFWRAVRENHPEVNGVQAALLLIQKMGDARLPELMRLLEKSEEKDLLGNSSAVTQAAANSELPGDTSTPSSHTTTAGDQTQSAS